ncbi:MAG: PPC domain-containing DNA-binding protein [Candidatus Helarchaeota archaeon]
MKIREIGINRMFLIKLEPNDKLLESITQAVQANTIKTGFFTAIGALNTANIGYYMLDQKSYKTITLIGDFEILACTGNVTLKDDSPFIHAHLIIADQEGKAYGGHLLPNCQISVTGEVFLVEAAKVLSRKLDKDLQLSLIHINKIGAKKKKKKLKL